MMRTDGRVAGVIALVFIASIAVAARAQDATDTVLLVNGGRVRGTVLVDDPAQGIVSVRMADGRVRTLKRVQISRVEYAGKAPPPPAPIEPVTVATAAPVTVVTQPNVRVEPVVETTTLKPVWMAGAIITLSVWALRAAITFGVCSSYSSNQRGCDGQDYAGAALPVIGAWVQAAQGIGGDHGASSAGAFGAIVGAGLVEAGGLAMFIIGLVVHRDVHRGPEPSGALHVFPSVTPRTIGVIGYF